MCEKSFRSPRSRSCRPGSEVGDQGSGEGVKPSVPQPLAPGPWPLASEPRYEAVEPFVDHLQVGMRVRHPDWGIGTIKERIGEGEDLKVVVTFAGVGRKKLAPKFVHLERA